MSDVLANWWQLLGSTELDGLMDRALANNQDLHIAAYRIAEAKARADQASADRFPSVSIPMAVSNVAPYYGIGTVQPGQDVTHKITYQASIRGDMRADIWGERQSQYQSSDLQLWSTTFQRDDVQRTLVANVVSAYVDYLSLNDRIRVARETESVLSGMENSSVERMKGGDATIIDVEQMRAQVNSVRATIPVLEMQREQVIDSIALLVGSVPGMLTLSDNGLDSLSFPAVLPGVPSALLLRRPDVRAIEAQLIASDANIDVARTEVLPPLDLTLEVGTGASTLSQLFKPNTIFWNAIANLSANIFDAGKRSSEVAYARAVHEEMVESYVRVIYRAVRDVEDSMAFIRKMGERLKAQEASVNAARRAWDFSSEAYSAGAVDYLVMLDTERTYHSKLDELHNVRRDRFRGLANLFLALGGGVQQGDVIPGKGLRPTLPAQANAGVESVATLETPSMEGIDFEDKDQNLNKKEVWLVQLPAIFESTLIVPAWRDLRGRFPQLMTDHRLWPRLQGRVEGKDSDTDRAAWYRLFVAEFASSKAAEEFCSELTGIRCRAVSSKSRDFLDGVAMAPKFRQKQESEPLKEASGPSKPVSESSPSVEAVPIQPPANRIVPELPPAVQPGPAPTAAPATQASVGAGAASTSAGEAVSEAGPDTGRNAATAESVGRNTGMPEAPVEHVARLGYAVQIGTFRTRAKANEMESAWNKKGYMPYMYKTAKVNGHSWYTVRIGKFSERAEASALAMSIRKKGRVHAIPVPMVLEDNASDSSNVDSVLRGRD